LSDRKTVVITGAAGSLGTRLRRHLEGRYDLRLLDLDPKDDPDIKRAEVGDWDQSWVDTFAGADTVVHLAALSDLRLAWSDLVRPNIDGVVNVYLAAVKHGVRRVVFASSNHAMGGYEAVEAPRTVTTDIPPLPDSPYGAAKLMAERIGKCFADAHGLSTIAVRIGWNQPGENAPEQIRRRGGDWAQKMWLSNQDFCQLFERCIEADPQIRFAVVNGMSDNTGMRWDIGETMDLIGYAPQDDIERGA
jgi:nucleoside-diphosphate-sugar epimerase